MKFLKDQIPKMQDYYSQVDKNPNTPSTNSASDTEQKLALRHWNYCVQLLKYMYEEGLLDRQEVLGWILELLERTKSQPTDDGILRLFLPLALQYLDEFVQSQLLSRRLAHLCCKKLGFMLNNVAENNLATSPHSEPVKTEQKEGEKEKKDGIAPNPLQSTLLEYQNCPHHRDIGIKFIILVNQNHKHFFCSTTIIYNHSNHRFGMSNSFNLVQCWSWYNLAWLSLGSTTSFSIIIANANTFRFRVLQKTSKTIRK